MLRRSTWTPPQRLRDREPPAVVQRIERSGVYGGSTALVAVPKQHVLESGNAEHAHKTALACLGCMACFRLHGPHDPGPVELHHLRSGGWGKGSYRTLIPLCVEHHRGASGVHGLGTKGFAKAYGFDQQDLLSDALEQLKEST